MMQLSDVNKMLEKFGRDPKTDLVEALDVLSDAALDAYGEAIQSLCSEGNVIECPPLPRPSKTNAPKHSMSDAEVDDFLVRLEVGDIDYENFG